MSEAHEHRSEPGNAGFLLPRPRLTRLLDTIVDHRITVIVAGVGSGKSTALAEWARSNVVAWHTASPGDGSLSQIAKAVVEVLRLRLPRLGSDLLSAIAEGTDDDADRAERSAARLGQEIHESSTDREVVLVVDDFHEMPSDSSGVAFVESLCRHSPPGLHIVLVSRVPTPFSLARFALESQLMEIGAEDLAFTHEETAALLSNVAGIDDGSMATSIAARSGGWAAVTRLAAEAIRTNTHRRLPAALLDERNERLFDYLANDVLTSEPQDVRELLRSAADLPWLTADLAQELRLGNGASSLGSALKRGVFFTRVASPPGGVALVPVIRDYLQTLPQAVDCAALLESAGHWYRRAGEYAAAIACYRAVGAHRALADLLVNHGPAVIAAGPLNEVIEACSDLPAQLRTDEIVLLEGEARQLIGDWDGALALFTALAPADGSMSAALAWRIGLLFYLRGDPRTASTYYERGGLDGRHGADEAMLLAWRGAAAWVIGDVPAAGSLANRALELGRMSDLPRALAAAHTVLAMVAASEGDRLANDAHYLKALEYAERARDTMQLIRIRVNRGSRSLEEGAYEAALEELDEALRLADLSGFAAFRALALSNRGQVLFHLGRLDEAITDLEESRAVYRRINSLNESYPLAHLGDVYRIRGDLALALVSYEQAIELAEQAGDLQGLVPALSGLSRLLVADDLDAAARAADRAVSGTSAIDHTDALLAKGWVDLGRGRDVASLAAHVVGMATSRRDLAAVADALELQAAADPARADALLGRARELWNDLGNPVRSALVDIQLATMKPPGHEAREQLLRSAVDRLRACGALGPARDAEALLAKPDTSPRIQTLGGFAVVRGSTVVGTSEWQSKKARDVLKMLVAARGKPLHREILLDRLWPNDDPKAASNRLSVALSTVRSVLDPEHRFPADHFIEADRDTVALVRGRAAVDIDAFLDPARRALTEWASGERGRALVALASAEAQYVGDFLEDEPYEEWAIPLREECRAVFMRVASTLATAAAEQGDWDVAVRHYLRMLERDPYHEPAHLGLVVAQSRLGRHGGARRLYGHYAARMQELGIDPAPFPHEVVRDRRDGRSGAAP